MYSILQELTLKGPASHGLNPIPENLLTMLGRVLGFSLDPIGFFNLPPRLLGEKSSKLLDKAKLAFYTASFQKQLSRLIQDMFHSRDFSGKKLADGGSSQRSIPPQKET